MRFLIAEYLVALGFVSWGAIKNHAAPWPPSIVYTSAAFVILGMVAQLSPELAGVLGAGFLLAALVRILGSGEPYYGGHPNPKNGWHWVPITWGDFPAK